MQYEVCEFGLLAIPFGKNQFVNTAEGQLQVNWIAIDLEIQRVSEKFSLPCLRIERNADTAATFS